MRTIIFVIALMLAGCGGSSDNDPVQVQTPDNDSNYVTNQQLSQAINQIPQVPNESTEVAAVRAQLAADEQKISQLQLIGKPVQSGSSRTASIRVESTGRYSQQVSSVSFGPCSTLGVMSGFLNSAGQPADFLTATSVAFKQCTQYSYEAFADGSLAQAPRIYWDGPGCTGNMLEWEAAGAGYNTSTLQNGVVFISPVDGVTTLMVKAGQTPQPTLIQSIWVLSSPGCQSDIETQNMYLVSTNDTSVSGVPNTSVGAFQITSP